MINIGHHNFSRLDFCSFRHVKIQKYHTLVNSSERELWKGRRFSTVEVVDVAVIEGGNIK